MEHLIISKKDTNKLVDLIPDSVFINVDDYQPTFDGYSDLKKVSGQDVIPFHIAKMINDLPSFSNVKSITIDLTEIKFSTGVLIGAHLMFFPNSNFNGPIISIVNDIAEFLQDKVWITELAGIHNYFQENRLELVSLEQAKKETFDRNELRCSGLFGVVDKYLGVKLGDFGFKNIEILPSSKNDNRHSIANQWGAVKLALNAGYGIGEINYTFPPTLYFNYLLKKHSIKAEPQKNKIDFSSLIKNKKVLLVDDNSEKGWKSVLERIFGNESIETKSFMMGISRKDNKGRWHMNEKLEKYDVIFLDLYIPDHQGQKPNLNNGKQLLKLIKSRNPEIPLIVFTASNKSWTREDVLQLGADGMYVKESPEYAGDQNYSKENFISFEKSVKDTLEKYKVLRPYWEATQFILKDQTFLSLPEKGSSNFKSRIEERLMMFYGLLKRGFEQTEFNESQFHFSDYELAFMTLWSALNEISEANYKKSQPNITIKDSIGNSIANHPNQRNRSGRPLTYLNVPNGPQHYKWQIVGQDEDVYVEYEYSLKIDRDTSEPEMTASGTYYKLNHEQKSCFLFDNDQLQVIDAVRTKVNYENTLFLQIAFLIHRKANFSICNSKSNYLQTLVRLNEVRNHLYLTHGSDVSTGFYDKTEKAKRVNHTIKPQGDIKDLFELISFLLTGIENKIDIK